MILLAALLLASSLSPWERVGVRAQLTPTPSPSPPSPPLLSEIDRLVRDVFWDPNLKGVDWTAAVTRAAREVKTARSPAERDLVYDRLLATLADSHTFRVPAGRLPERNWGTAGLRIGRDGEGYAVKGVIPGTAADRAGFKSGDRVLAVDRKPYGRERVNFRDLFLVFEGVRGSAVDVTWRPLSGGAERTERLARGPEEPGETLAWKSARVIEREGKKYGYARLWGIGTETALAVVDMLLDRNETPRSRSQLAGWEKIEGFLLDVRGNAGGYDPNILPTFLRGRWSCCDFTIRTREGRRLTPPDYQPLPVALLVNSGTASAGEALALKFRRHAIGPIVGEPTAGMASGGADARKLSDGSMLWINARAIEDLDGRFYEGEGVPPDIAVPDRDESIIDAAIKALQSRKAGEGRK